VLKSTESSKSGYDILILSDLLHFFDSHDVLVSTIELLLSKGSNARVYVGVGLYYLSISRSRSDAEKAGKYTHTHVCENFLQKGKSAGLLFDEVVDKESESGWMGSLQVSNLDRDDLSIRKANCRYWIGSWADEHP